MEVLHEPLQTSAQVTEGALEAFDHPALKPGALQLMDLEEWRQKFAAHVYRTPDSIKWFLRQHRDELIEAGALVAPNGRFLVQPQRFETAVHQIGQRLAATLRR